MCGFVLSSATSQSRRRLVAKPRVRCLAVRQRQRCLLLWGSHRWTISGKTSRSLRHRYIDKTCGASESSAHSALHQCGLWRSEFSSYRQVRFWPSKIPCIRLRLLNSSVRSASFVPSTMDVLAQRCPIVISALRKAARANKRVWLRHVRPTNPPRGCTAPESRTPSGVFTSPICECESVAPLIRPTGVLTHSMGRTRAHSLGANQSSSYIAKLGNCTGGGRLP